MRLCLDQAGGAEEIVRLTVEDARDLALVLTRLAHEAEGVADDAWTWDDRFERSPRSYSPAERRSQFVTP